MVVGDSLTVLRALPAGSVDLVLTSPPFLALRSYLPINHPDKAHEIGQEGTPAAFIDALLDVVEECRRVLAPHGSIAFELGDTYSGSGGAGGDYNEDGLRAGQQRFDGSARRSARVVCADGRTIQPNGIGNGQPRKGDGWPLDKSLCLIPELFRFALVYGFNPLTGRTTPQWRARNVVRWCRPNPPVGDLGDKFRPGTSEMVVACTSAKRWFDLDAVRTPHKEPADALNARQRGRPNYGHPGFHTDGETVASNPAGAPPLDWWEIPTHGYPGAHYATFPPALCVRPIQAMCPREVCRACGTPRRRIVESPTDYASRARRLGIVVTGTGAGSRTQTVESLTLGWTTCDCPEPTYRPGVVLDPFGGSGTTAQVATGDGRDCLLIDLDERNLDLARERVGMWLTEATTDDAAAWLERTPAEVTA
jgi:hypothetical protein